MGLNFRDILKGGCVFFVCVKASIYCVRVCKNVFQPLALEQVM